MVVRHCQFDGVGSGTDFIGLGVSIQPLMAVKYRKALANDGKCNSQWVRTNTESGPDSVFRLSIPYGRIVTLA